MEIEKENDQETPEAAAVQKECGEEQSPEPEAGQGEEENPESAGKTRRLPREKTRRPGQKKELRKSRRSWIKNPRGIRSRSNSWRIK